MGTYLTPWQFEGPRWPESLLSLLWFQPQGLGEDGARGEREPCASPGVDRWPPQAPGSQVPHLFLGRSEILLALSFSRIDLGPLGASEKVLTHFGFARVFQR